MVKIVKRNGDSIFKTITPRTRLKFSIGVIIANFILGIIGMILGSDLTALGVFLAMANSPLYVYVLGQSFSPTKIPEQYYNQSHGGSGGLGNIINYNKSSNVSDTPSTQQNSVDEYNIPPKLDDSTTKPKPVVVVDKPEDEIG